LGPRGPVGSSLGTRALGLRSHRSCPGSHLSYPGRSNRELRARGFPHLGYPALAAAGVRQRAPTGSLGCTPGGWSRPPKRPVAGSPTVTLIFKLPESLLEYPEIRWPGPGTPGAARFGVPVAWHAHILLTLLHHVTSESPGVDGVPSACLARPGLRGSGPASSSPPGHTWLTLLTLRGTLQAWAPTTPLLDLGDSQIILGI